MTHKKNIFYKYLELNPEQSDIVDMEQQTIDSAVHSIMWSILIWVTKQTIPAKQRVEFIDIAIDRYRDNCIILFKKNQNNQVKHILTPTMDEFCVQLDDNMNKVRTKLKEIFV